MHKSPLLLLPIMLVLASLVAGACASRPATHSAINITDPHNGNTFPSGADVDLHVTFSGLGGQPGAWESYEYQVLDNGQIVSGVANIPISQSRLSPTLRALANGTHLVVIRGRAARPDPAYTGLPNDTHRIFGDWYASTPLCFFVGPNPPEGLCSNAALAGPVGAATAGPVPTFATTQVPVIQSLDAFPAQVRYGKACPSLTGVTFRAVVSLPAGAAPDIVQAQAHVFVRVGAGTLDSGSFVVPLHPAGTPDPTAGGALYTGTLALNHGYNDADSHFDPSALAGATGALIWYVDASSTSAAGSSAVSLGRTMDQVIDLAPCPNGTPSPAQNSSAANSSTSDLGCAQYGNELSCSLAGCAWAGSVCTISP